MLASQVECPCGITLTFPISEGTLLSLYILLEKMTTTKQIQKRMFTLLMSECVFERQPLAVTCVPYFPGYDCKSERSVTVTTHASVPVFILGVGEAEADFCVSVMGRSVCIALHFGVQHLPPGQVLNG